MKRNSQPSLSAFVDTLSDILKKNPASGADITDLISISMYRNPESQLALDCKATNEKPHTARISNFLLQHPNVVSIKIGAGKGRRLFFYTETKELPYQDNQQRDNKYLPAEER